jgi:hypothetical protein
MEIPTGGGGLSLTGSRNSAGQSLLEAAIALPLLLALLAGGYWGFRRLSLEGAAASASQAELLRSGREQPDIATSLAASVASGGKGITVSSRTGILPGGMPPFPALSGRTVSSVAVSLEKEEAGAFVALPSHGFRAVQEGAVDCWTRGSRSGASVRRTVRGLLYTGVLR